MPISGTGVDPVFPDLLGILLRPIRNSLDLLAQNNIKVNINDVLVYETLSRTFDDADRNSLFNRFDLEAHVLTWTLPDHGHGIFTTLIRFNNNVLDTKTPSVASGAFSPFDDIANDTTFLINRLEFQQQLLDKHVNLTIGKANPNDVIASNLFAWDEDHQFMSVTFDGGNYPYGYGGYFPLIAVQATPMDGIYFSGMVTNPPGTPYQIASTLGNGLYWCAGEVGTILEVGPDKLQGRYSIALMNSNTGPATTDHATRSSGNAMAIVIQQEVAQNVIGWTQYLLCSENIGPAEQEFTLGLSIERCFGREDDGFGIAVGWSKPSGTAYPGWRENIQFETYYRLQLTHTWQISPDFQIVRPADPAAEDKPVFSFALRLLTTF